jgi:hypothetical protein
MEEFKLLLTDIARRLKALEAVRIIKNLVIPNDGKFVVDKRASDPAVEEGRIYYNTVSKKHRGCDNAAWHDLY